MTIEHAEITWRDVWGKSKFFIPKISAIGPISSNTEYFDAGVIKIGVEVRHFNNAVIAAHALTNEYVEVPEEKVDDGGVSFHVFDADSQHEYLRFDCFRHDKHYHYLVPGLDGVVVVRYDDIANGPMVPWVLNMLRTRVRTLLQAAGAAHLAEAVDEDLIERALRALMPLVDSAENSAAPVRTS